MVEGDGGGLMSRLTKVLPYKEIGWKEYDETFYRFIVIKTRWFNIYLHKLTVPIPHAQCHDHPWSFLAIILWGGYWELHDGAWHWRGPGSVLFRRAEFDHNVVTLSTNWSLVITGPRKRAWGFTSCDGKPYIVSKLGT